MKATPFALLVLAGTLIAQELASELAPLAKKFDDEMAAFDEARRKFLEPAKKVYMTAIEMAEKTETGATHDAVAAAAAAERTAVEDAEMSPAPQGYLPKSLIPARKTYMDAVAKAEQELSLRKKRLATDYLGRMDFLPARTRPDLTMQIAREKTRALSRISSADGDAQSAKNLAVNGGFGQFNAKGELAKWKLGGPEATVEVEGNNHFLRFKKAEAVSGFAVQTILVPPNVRTVKISLRMRSDSNVNAGFAIHPKNAEEKINGGYTRDFVPIPKWKEYSETQQLKEGIVTMEIRLDSQKGQIDFDDVMVEMY